VAFAVLRLSYPQLHCCETDITRNPETGISARVPCEMATPRQVCVAKGLGGVDVSYFGTSSFMATLGP